ncbi:hypothetical protein BKA01_002827 [Pseudonocardia eucalypti]|nr:hypothetical protein [Pseudonocardia eucalypti]
MAELIDKKFFKLGKMSKLARLTQNVQRGRDHVDATSLDADQNI